MATDKRAIAICDICGFQYPHRDLKKNSYGLMVCPTDYEGSYDLKNHPQNKTPNVKDDERVRDARPASIAERNSLWESATSDWEDTNQDWNMI